MQKTLYFLLKTEALVLARAPPTLLAASRKIRETKSRRTSVTQTYTYTFTSAYIRTSSETLDRTSPEVPLSHRLLLYA